MKFGSFDIEMLETGTFGLDGGAMFGVVPKNLWSKAYDPGDEENRIPMAARSLLIRTGERNILVDTGNGTKFAEKHAKIYKIDTSVHDMERSLARVGLLPSDITDVILTHLHFDHAGGATSLVDGKLVPSFPNARYYVQQYHYGWAQSPTEKDRASFVAENYEPLVAEGMLELVDGEGELFPGVSIKLAFGHTRALQLVRVQSEGQTLLAAADLFPTHAHIRVPFVMGYDNFPLTAMEEKRDILPRIAEERWLVCFGHDAFMQAAYISQTDKGYAVAEKVCITPYAEDRV